MNTIQKYELLMEFRGLFISHKEHFESGFCAFIIELNKHQIINDFKSTQFQILLELLDITMFKYSFPKGDYNSRLQFLNREIIRMSKVVKNERK